MWTFIFLLDLYNQKNKLNYFIDLKNIYRIKYHNINWNKIICSQTGYDKKNIYPECKCLLCDQGDKWQIVIFADILIFDKNYKYDNSKILYLSEQDYQQLLRENKYLF